MDVALWVLQVLLALAFLAVGVSHAFAYERGIRQPRMGWLQAVGRDNMRIIGILEILGAIGVVAPAATGILPWLTPIAAAMLGLLMVFAAIFHLRRSGEMSNVAVNVVLGVIAFAVAIGRSFIEPL